MFPVRLMSVRVVPFAALLLGAVSLNSTVDSASPAATREPSAPATCSTGVNMPAQVWAACKSGHGTYRVWARCNWSASTQYGPWKPPGRFSSSAALCNTSTHPRGIVMAHGIQKRDG